VTLDTAAPRGPRTRARGGRLALPVCLLAMALSCRGPDSTLEGSLTEVLDVAYTGIEISVTDWAIIVSYVRPHLTARDTVLRLVVYVAPVDVVPNQIIDLSPREDGTARATLTRAVGGDPIRTLAAIKSGQLILSAIPEVDKPVSGEWRVTLDEGGDAGKGRTAFGTFRTAAVKPGN
jgi:hypothetical protein